MWKYDTPKSAKILAMPPGQAEEAEPLWGQRFLTAWLTSSPFLIFKYAAERGPALTQTPPVLSERWGRQEGENEDHREASTQMRRVLSSLPAVGGGMIPSCGSILGIPEGEHVLPLFLATDFKEFTFSPGQGLSDLRHFWKVFSAWRDEHDQLEKHPWPQSSSWAVMEGHN